MNPNLLQQLVNWPHYFISGTELKAILTGAEDARKAIIKRAVHEGYLQRLRRDYYLIRNIANKPIINTFELAQFIYGPSYIGFESALSYHEWIPERVAVTCSATVKQTKSFNTSVGEFSFEKNS
jgi:predicted transcriptional regulator of viral defense system